jgi:hypothetical protein
VKKKFTGILVISFVLIGLVAAFGWSFLKHYLTLTWADLVFALDDNKYVELSRSETNEEYYNRWLCFDARNAEVSDAIIEYGTVRKVPLIDVKSGKSVFQFNVDPEVEWNTDAVQNRWRAFLKNQNSVCIFSVYSQTDDDGTEVRYIRRVKTHAGTWDKLDKAYQK